MTQTIRLYDIYRADLFSRAKAAELASHINTDADSVVLDFSDISFNNMASFYTFGQEIRNDLLPSRKQEMTQLSIIIALERCIIRQLRATDAPMIETLADLDVQSAGSLQNASTFAKQCCVYLSLLYQMDIIEEALILAWHRNPIISLRYGLSKTEVIAIRKAVLPFVNYLLSPPAAPQEAAPADEAEEPELQVAATDDL